MMRVIFYAFVLLLPCYHGTAQTLKIITYNIRLDHPVDSANQWPLRDHAVYALLKKYNPDIFGVQEALHHQMLGLQKNLSQYTSVGVGRDDGDTAGEYTALFFKTKRFKVIEQNTFWLSQTPTLPGSKDWDAAITRIATWAKLRDKKNKTTFVVLNTHFDHIGEKAREESAKLIKQKLLSIAGSMPVIVMGDFNCTDEETPYAVMIGNSAPLLFDAHPKDNTQGTYCTFNVGTPCQRIDYLFFSSHWNLEQYLIIEDHNGKFYPSDHLPVMGSFKLQLSN
jgi:endonuclease/exonuclease/phosphatase family metal-dependent hydrolase